MVTLTEAQCEAAAGDHGKAGMNTISFNNYPAGCYAGSGLYAVFNEPSTPGMRSDQYLICGSQACASTSRRLGEVTNEFCSVTSTGTGTFKACMCPIPSPPTLPPSPPPPPAPPNCQLASPDAPMEARVSRGDPPNIWIAGAPQRTCDELDGEWQDLSEAGCHASENMTGTRIRWYGVVPEHQRDENRHGCFTVTLSDYHWNILYYNPGGNRTGAASAFMYERSAWVCGNKFVCSPATPPSLPPSPPSRPPPPPPPPPSPPLPPHVPGTVCTNTCDDPGHNEWGFNGGLNPHSYSYGHREEVEGHSEDGVCNDGGDGSADHICAIGTDCADCGPRIVEPPSPPPLPPSPPRRRRTHLVCRPLRPRASTSTATSTATGSC